MSACQSAAPRPAPPDDPVQRLAAYDQLAVSARDFLDRFHSKINGYRLPAEEGENPEDTDIDPAQYEAYDECRADYGEMAMHLMEAVAGHAPKERTGT
ncbi:hypothetical protein PV411_30345 [Streptomyces sp. NRRL_B-16638]|uniref:Uncharacterized protein n=2 Tax=Streptomyces coelicolor TaxID=1902 RepID=Q99Q07_STRCO|nr:hypothetical protein [Streptomyces sp. NRRL_B-16638]AGO88472.1 hypothetical protein [Streptomyces coelicolor]MDX2928824.1 hypothetical protein [Streptomyces sp. NRRL_B-16638]CAC36529.1 hypothetical protein [Streptomyces coelicolor A3(2)]CAC36872.1 hypothetical protein [Streptomyces coelicolor A3(2)]